MKQLPDWLRRALGLPERFRQKGHLLHVPWEVEFTFNEILERMLAGFGRDLQSVSHLKTPTLVKTAQKVLDAWVATMKKAYKESSSSPESMKLWWLWMWIYFSSNIFQTFRRDSMELWEAVGSVQRFGWSTDFEKHFK